MLFFIMRLLRWIGRGRRGIHSLTLLSIGFSAMSFETLPTLAQSPPAPSPTPLTAAQQSDVDQLKAQGDQALIAKDYPAAEKAYQTGLDHATTFGNDTEALVFTNGLYQVYTLEIVYDKGLVIAHQAFAIAQRKHDPAATCTALIQIGTLQRESEQYDAALDTLGQALNLAKVQKDMPQTAQSLYELGMVRLFRGQLADSEDFFSRAMSLYENLQDKGQVAACEYNLAFAYINDGDYRDAENLLNTAFIASTYGGFEDGIAKSYLGLGMLDYLQGKYTDAIKKFQGAVGVNASFPSPANEAWALMGLSLSESSVTGKSAQAVVDSTACVKVFTALNNETFLVLAYLTLGTAQASAGNLPAARDAYQRATDDYEQLSRGVVDPRELGGLQQLTRHLYARYAAVLVRMGKPGDALVEVESGRGQGLARQAKVSGVNFSDRLSAADADALKASDAELTRTSSLLRAENGEGISDKSDPTDPLLVQYQEAKQGNNLLVHRLYEANPDYKLLHSFAPPTQEQLQALAAKHSDTLYVEWAIVDDKTTLLFALSQKDGLHAYSLPLGEHALSLRTEMWRTQIGAPEGGRGEPEEATSVRRATIDVNGPAPVDQAYPLYKALLGPLAAAGILAPGRYARIVFVPDGPLLDIPLAALSDSQKHLLIDQYGLSNSISLGILTWPDGNHQSADTLMCAADPMGTKGEVSRVAKREGFGPLPGARAEANAIAPLFSHPLVMIGPGAREGQIKAEMGKYAILHFATHAVPDAENGLRSHLILAPEPADSPEDGELEAREIVGIPLTARLAVLSACETGRGQQSGGEGLIGLVWAFRAAGCPSVVASLWEVDDQATSKLMEAFYNNLRAGARKDDALRLAIQTVRKSFPLPRDWAAFQVIGDTTPIPKTSVTGAPAQ